MKAVWNDTTIAQSNATIDVEGNAYFAPEDVHQEYLQTSDHHTICPWKGEASYYNIVVNGSVNPNAAWHYPHPKDAAANIQGRIAFWRGVQVTAD